MRRLLHLSLSLLLAGGVFAQAPRQFRISAQFVEMPHPLVTALLAAPDQRGHIIHQLAMERVAKGEAKILEQCVIVAKSGRKATLETIGEFIYPTEYEEPQLPCGGISPKREFPRPKPSPSAWDTRNTGVTFEVEPAVGENDKVIALRFQSEVVQLVRLETITEYRASQGDHSIRMPVFEAMRIATELPLMAGRFELAAILTPKPTAPGPALNKKVMLFMRAEILTLPSNR